MIAAALEDNDWHEDAVSTIVGIAAARHEFTSDDLRREMRPAPHPNHYGTASEPLRHRIYCRTGSRLHRAGGLPNINRTIPAPWRPTHLAPQDQRRSCEVNDFSKEPDFYATNHGVDVERETRYPESGQVSIRVAHNAHQSTRLQLGLEQAEELQGKLAALIAQIRAAS